MKKNLFILVIVLSILPISSLEAKRRVIALTQQAVFENDERWQTEKRSIPNNILFILHNETTFYIYSYDLLEEVKLTIRDRYNNIVYSTVETILPNEDNMFTLDIEKGKYTIELESKEGIYYGYFEITK